MVGTPKSSTLLDFHGFSMKETIQFGVPLFQETSICFLLMMFHHALSQWWSLCRYVMENTNKMIIVSLRFDML